MPKALDTVYRVVKLPDSLRQDLRRAREARGVTNAVFVAEAVKTQLPKLIDSLQTLGFSARQGPRRPTRLPFSVAQETLKQLHSASQASGVSAVQLLTACLLAAVQVTPRKRGNRVARRRRRSRGEEDATS